MPHFRHPVARRLQQIIARKKTPLALSLDLCDKHAFLALADALGPYICVLKTHVDIIDDFDFSFITALKTLAQKHDFLLFEDRKFADIGETVKHQFGNGIYRIAEWADMVTVHGIAGPGTLQGLKAALTQETGFLLLTEMSSQGNLISPEMSAEMLAWAQRDENVMGIIAQHRPPESADLVVFTPGIHLDKTGDGLGQQYRRPAAALAAGSDVLIVGRALYAAADPVHEAQRYCQAISQG
jgi:orotidine 5'-phosphate decarboxylase subfamily 1